jgi:hypothetical protein
MAWSHRRTLLASASLLLGGVLVILRGRPSLQGDAGVFMSVAGRLDRGDRLYVDVIDNKDPLFYYTHAAALALLGWKGPYLLDVAWLAIAAASFAMLLQALDLPTGAIALGFFSYPFLLAGSWYMAGYSMLPSLALIPLVGWLWLTGRFMLAGAVVGVGGFLQINIVPLLASMPIALLVLRRPSQAVRRPVLLGVAGFAAVALAGCLALALAGELSGYVRNIVRNVAYSHDAFKALKETGGIAGHIKVAAFAIANPVRRIVVGVLFVVAAFVAARALGRSRTADARRTQDSRVRTAAALFLCATVATVLTLSLTAVWPQHDQMLAYPGTMLAVLIYVVAEQRGAGRYRRAASWALALVAVVLVGGSVQARNGRLSSWFHGAHSEPAALIEDTVAGRLPGSQAVTFAHLGSNDEEGFAAFLANRFSLACPEIDQYVFTPNLTSTLRCIRVEKPEVVLVTPSLRRHAGVPAWNRFVTEGERMLNASYERAATGKGLYGVTEVWVLRAATRGRTADVSAAVGTHPWRPAREASACAPPASARVDA